jgi:hypothetical protein
MTGSTAARALYDDPGAVARMAAAEPLARLQEKHREENQAHRARLPAALARLAARHQRETRGYGSYRPPERVQQSQKKEEKSTRAEHEITGQELELRQNRERQALERGGHH